MPPFPYDDTSWCLMFWVVLEADDDNDDVEMRSKLRRVALGYVNVGPSSLFVGPM